MKKTKQPTHQKQEKTQELENQLKRALADYQNLERRVEEERRLLSSLSSAILIEKFLPVLDNLESAQSHLKDQGLDLVIKQFEGILEQEGVTQIKAGGEQFDPSLHEAVEVTEGENNGRIVKVIAKGYKLNDKVLKPAKVVVERTQSEKPASPADGSKSEVDQSEETEPETMNYEQ